MDLKITNPQRERVKLRARKLRDGSQSLYLDISDRGLRRTETLRLYLIPERTREDAEQNARTLKEAESVRALRIVEMRNGTYGFARGFNDRADFMGYVWAKIEEREPGSSVYANLRSAALRLQDFGGESFAVGDIGQRWLELFVRYLQEELKPSTAFLYFERVREMLGWAVRDGLIPRNPSDGVKPPKKDEPQREFLTLEELRRLVDTPCRHDVSRPFIFSCLTGLRMSDIRALRWGAIKETAGGCRASIRSVKTGRLVGVELNAQAVNLMGRRGASGEAIFSPPDPSTTNKVLRRWCEAAGIEKHITFHCGRHTFATLQLTLGTDIYTVSKLLDHRSVRTTQIYAKVVDERKREAVERIPNLFKE